jgi:hypothetical protein
VAVLFRAVLIPASAAATSGLLAAALTACGPITNGSLHSTYHSSNAGDNAGSYAAAAPSTTTDSGVLPRPADFQIKVIETKRDCFGDVGCNIEYEIDPIYIGSATLTNKTFRVFYSINGGENPKSDSFTVSGGSRMHYDKTGYLSTDSNYATITATVTQVVAEDS